MELIQKDEVYRIVGAAMKVHSELRQEHIAQVMNYLKATKTRIGVLINFGERSLKYKRVIC